MRNLLRAFPQSDESVFYANAGSAIVAGALVQLGDSWGVACVDIAATTGTGTVAITGEYKLTKGTGYTLAQGQAWTWDGTKVVGWTPASTTPRGGTVTEAAGTNDTSAVCRLEQNKGPRVFASSFTITSTEAALNSNNGRYDFNTGFGVAPTSFNVIVLTSSTGVQKTGYAISALGGADAGKVRIDGIAAGVQLDAGDIILLQAWK